MFWNSPWVFDFPLHSSSVPAIFNGAGLWEKSKHIHWQSNLHFCQGQHFFSLPSAFLYVSCTVHPFLSLGEASTSSVLPFPWLVLWGWGPGRSASWQLFSPEKKSFQKLLSGPSLQCCTQHPVPGACTAPRAEWDMSSLITRIEVSQWDAAMHLVELHKERWKGWWDRAIIHKTALYVYH